MRIAAGVVLLVTGLLAQDALMMPRVTGENLYTGTKPLRRMGMVVRYVQEEKDTAVAQQFVITGQEPDSGTAVEAGDSAVVRYNLIGMLLAWEEWAVPLAGDMVNNIAYLRTTVRPEAIVQAQAAYPEVLAEISFKGRALVEALVDFDGSVIAARLVLSSGFAQADTEACRAALGSRFSPAENREVPCRVWVRLPYEWDYEVKERLKSSKPSQEYDPSRNQY